MPGHAARLIPRGSDEPADAGTGSAACERSSSISPSMSRNAGTAAAPTRSTASR